MGLSRRRVGEGHGSYSDLMRFFLFLGLNFGCGRGPCQGGLGTLVRDWGVQSRRRSHLLLSPRVVFSPLVTGRDGVVKACTKTRQERAHRIDDGSDRLGIQRFGDTMYVARSLFPFPSVPVPVASAMPRAVLASSLASSDSKPSLLRSSREAWPTAQKPSLRFHSSPALPSPRLGG